jgi:hypothetical protein
MKCLELADGVDVCVTVSVKLIYRQSKTDDIRKELVRNDAKRKAKYLGGRQEAVLAGMIKEELAGEDLGVAG